jgi:uncharacterized protein
MSAIFPAGLAMGEAFYDRKKERSYLKKNIKHGVHTVLIAPRRFGKTSLIKKTLDETATSHIWLDFMAITAKDEAQTRFLNHISDLVVRVAKTEERLKSYISKYFSLFKPEITVGIPGILKITFKPENIPHAGITEALLKLDQLAQDINKRLVIVCDEFQEIVNIDKDATLQASIRHAAERSLATTYIFSGSKHQPLRRLFNGKQNPLYELCDQMSIERITEDDYRDYLQIEAKKKWGYPLSEEILAKIFYYTDYYPKYVNALCAKIWFSELDPTPELVDTLWENYIFTRKVTIAEELNDLTLNQRKLLRYLCNQPTASLFSHQTAVAAGLATSAIQTALPGLLDRDLVIKINDLYRVLDPTFKHYFAMF